MSPEGVSDPISPSDIRSDNRSSSRVATSARRPSTPIASTDPFRLWYVRRAAAIASSFFLALSAQGWPCSNERIALVARARMRKSAYAGIARDLSAEQKDNLAQLLVAGRGPGRTTLTWLREYGSHTPCSRRDRPLRAMSARSVLGWNWATLKLPRHQGLSWAAEFKVQGRSPQHAGPTRRPTLASRDDGR